MPPLGATVEGPELGAGFDVCADLVVDLDELPDVEEDAVAATAVEEGEDFEGTEPVEVLALGSILSVDLPSLLPRSRFSGGGGVAPGVLGWLVLVLDDDVDSRE